MQGLVVGNAVPELRAWALAQPPHLLHHAAGSSSSSSSDGDRVSSGSGGGNSDGCGGSGTDLCARGPEGEPQLRLVMASRPRAEGLMEGLAVLGFLRGGMGSQEA